MSEVNVSALVKGSERYIMLWDDQHYYQTHEFLARWAANHDLSYTHWDRARQAKEMSGLMRAAWECERETQRPRRPR